MEAEREALRVKFEQDLSAVRSESIDKLNLAQGLHQQVSQLKSELQQAQAKAAQAEIKASEAMQRVQLLEVKESSMMERLEADLEAAHRLRLGASELELSVRLGAEDVEAGMPPRVNALGLGTKSTAEPLAEARLTHQGASALPAGAKTRSWEPSLRPGVLVTAQTLSRKTKGKGKGTPQPAKRKVVVEVVSSSAQVTDAHELGPASPTRPSITVENSQVDAQIMDTKIDAAQEDIPQLMTPTPDIPQPVGSEDGHDADLPVSPCGCNVASELASALRAAQAEQEEQEETRVAALEKARRDLFALQDLLLN